MFVETITKKIKTWATKTTSYVRRVVLINSVLKGVYNFWATIFILPYRVIKELESISRNYLWGAVGYISWEDINLRRMVGQP